MTRLMCISTHTRSHAKRKSLFMRDSNAASGFARVSEAMSRSIINATEKTARESRIWNDEFRSKNSTASTKKKNRIVKSCKRKSETKTKSKKYYRTCWSFKQPRRNKVIRHAKRRNETTTTIARSRCLTLIFFFLGLHAQDENKTEKIVSPAIDVLLRRNNKNY